MALSDYVIFNLASNTQSDASQLFNFNFVNCYQFFNCRGSTIYNLIVSLYRTFSFTHIFRRNVLNGVLKESEVNRLEDLTE